MEYELLERGAGFNSALFRYARNLLRAAVERAKPDGQRLEEYQEAGRASFEHELFAQNPVYEDLEVLKLTDSLTALVEGLGWNHPVVRKALDGQSPHQLAAAAVGGSKLALPATRRQLYEGGLQALDQAQDPLIELARRIDTEARAVRKEVEARREAIRQAHAQIGKARYALDGATRYPDATGTCACPTASSPVMKKTAGMSRFKPPSPDSIDAPPTRITGRLSTCRNAGLPTKTS